MQKKFPLETTSKKIDYIYAGKESLAEIIRKSFPKQLIPTKKMGPILGWIFLAVIIIALVQFPLDQMLSGNVDITIGVGYPWYFLEFDLLDVERPPLLPVNLFLDLILYIIIAYIIDIALNLILTSSIFKSEKEKRRRPVVFKDKKSNVAEKVTKKVFKKSIR